MDQKLRGVNLGGWLVLERWITPSLFEGLKAQDETAFCIELGEEKVARLQNHRQNFITKKDFKWLAEIGINSVRIPVPHWIFGDVEPYEGGIEFLDWAMEEAKKHSLEVILDIHTAPGSQNGRSHSGLSGEIGWHKNKQNIKASLDFLTRLMKRYRNHPNLWGIELLNEPRGWMSPKILKNYYKEGYEIVRKVCGDNVAVIISDYFAPWRWRKFMSEPEFKNIIRDTHLYQCHRPEDKRLNMKQHLSKVGDEWSKLVAQMQKNQPLIIGEWSLALVAETFSQMTQEEKKSALKSYGQAQLVVFEEARGWFYWTYKTEDASGWNFRHCSESGLLPDNF